MDNIIDIIFKVIYCFGWLISLLILLCARATLKRIEKKTKKTDYTMSKNKENQTEREKELKSMGKFLCDACGKETEVRKAKQLRQYDICPDCYAEFQKMDAQYQEAVAALEEADRRAKAARDKLTNFNGVLNKVAANVPAPVSIEEEKAKEEPKAGDQSVDVLKNLGL